MKISMAAAVLSLLCLTTAGYAQSVKSPEAKAKEQACKTEAKAKTFANKDQKKAFLNECQKR